MLAVTALALVVMAAIAGWAALQTRADAAALGSAAPPALPAIGPRLRPPDAEQLAVAQPTPEPTPPPAAAPTTTATPLPTATPTLPPTFVAVAELPTVTPVPADVLSEAAPPAALLPTVQLTGLRHAWQTWNNCGPATLAMNLSYYGSPLDQAAIGAALRPFADDKNVSPHELAAYAADQGYFAEVRAGGSTELARQFLNQGIPLLIETWLEEEPNNGMGHYRLLVGYDDAAQQWTAFDSYVQSPAVSPDPAAYRGIYLPYAETDFLWNVFNHTYVLIYPPDRAPAVAAILGEAQAPGLMWQQAFNAAQRAVLQTPGDPFAHFNLGTSLVELGDYVGAAAAFDQARALGLPWRMFWYQFGIFRAYAETGRYADMVSLADATLAVTDSLEELHYWRGRGLEGLGDLAGARVAYNRALSLNPNFTLATDALAALPG